MQSKTVQFTIQPPASATEKRADLPFRGAWWAPGKVHTVEIAYDVEKIDQAFGSEKWSKGEHVVSFEAEFKQFTDDPRVTVIGDAPSAQAIEAKADAPAKQGKPYRG